MDTQLDKLFTLNNKVPYELILQAILQTKTSRKKMIFVA